MIENDTKLDERREEYAAAENDDEREALIADWRAHRDRFDAAIREVTAAEPLPAEEWGTTDPAPREWLIRDMLPANRLAALYGTGGAGKSTLALQLAAAVMHGGSPLRTRPGMDKAEALANDHTVLQPLPEASQGRVLWLTWEDETDELIRRWRMAHHAGAIAPAFPDPERLTLIDMRKIGGPLWGPERGLHVSSAATWTDAGRRFLRTLQGHKLAIVDPLAAAFASSEIDRALVRAFTSAIDGEAEAAGCTVLLIAHPSQSGAGKGGGGYSGSTDWQASVRAHLVLEASDETRTTGKDESAKPRAWRLANPKQSYALSGAHLWLVRRWRPMDLEHFTPAELAWFGASVDDAVTAFEASRGKRDKGDGGASSPAANDASRTGRGDGSGRFEIGPDDV